MEQRGGRLAPGAPIFMGDVRCLPLLEAFHASVELQSGPAPVRPGPRADPPRGPGRKELVIDPAFFPALAPRVPSLSAAAVLAKRDTGDNEMAKFRYDVMLHLDRAPAAVDPLWRPWPENGDVAGALAVADGPIGFLGVPNARVATHVAAARAVRSPSGRQPDGDAAASAGAVDPEVVWQTAEQAGHRAHLSWARGDDDGAFDVVFLPAHLDDGRLPRFPEPVLVPGARHANHPVGHRQRQARARRLVPELKTYLRSRLPDYMTPSAFMVLEALPHAGWQARPRRPPGPRGWPRPRGCGGAGTPAEEVVAGIWAEVLGLHAVGVTDSFFDLGGHSLLATQVISRVRLAFGVELPLRAIFEEPTVEGLAESVARMVLEQIDALPDDEVIDLLAALDESS